LNVILCQQELFGRHSLTKTWNECASSRAVTNGRIHLNVSANREVRCLVWDLCL